MFWLFNVASLASIFGSVPESLEVLIFGIALVLLAIGLRWLMKGGEKSTNGEIERSR